MFQEWPANELSSIKQAFPNVRLQANMTPRLSASPKSLQAIIGETHLSRELARCETIFSRICLFGTHRAPATNLNLHKTQAFPQNPPGTE